MGNTSRKLDPETTRNAILDAAEALFVDCGVNGVSMSEIAREAGVTKSLIHHHFGSKGELWHVIKERGISEYLELQRQLLESRDPDEGLLVDSLDIYFRFLQKRPGLVRLMSWMLLESEGIDKRDDPVMGLGIARLEEAQRVGTVREDLDPQSIIVLFLAVVERWFQCRELYQLDWNGDPDEVFLDTVKKILAQGLRGPNSADPKK